MTSLRANLMLVRSGLLSTIQDKGRFGLRHLGIPWAGAVCPAWQAISNALVNNPIDAPIIECFEGGLEMEAQEHAVQMAVVGCELMSIKVTDGNGQERICQANQSFTLMVGERIHLLTTGSSRHAVIAIAGIDIIAHLGSTSTYAKAAIGGLDGHVLKTSDTIPVQIHAEVTQIPVNLKCHLIHELRFQSTELRAIAGPQFDHFSNAGIDTFLSATYELSGEADRMGARLTGTSISHLNASAKDIVSDAIVPGSIQVPGSGQPIVLLNDAHTAGGYPKIATVISADLPLLGIQRAGTAFTFRLIDITEAISIRNRTQQLIEKCISSFTPCIKNELDTRTLLSLNLIDGVTDGS